VDKKVLLSELFIKNMLDLSTHVQDLVRKHSPASVSFKPDGSPVTTLDLALTELIENEVHQHYPETSIYSEESEKNWSFPLISIDPLDGTREFVNNRPEWALSVAYLPSEKFEGTGWIYNPLTNESFYQGNSGDEVKNRYLGEVSRSEWEKGLFKTFQHQQFEIRPMGSIAYKLGRLASKKIDFVVSLRPKDLWDIAAGTVLCHQAGLSFYSQGKKVTEVKKFYEPPLIWCSEKISDELLRLFQQKDKFD